MNQTILSLICASVIKKTFNALKNPIRVQVLENLSDNQPRTLWEIRKLLRTKKYYHSQSVLETYYLIPLLESKLIEKEDIYYRITPLGVKILKEISANRKSFTQMLKHQGKCYEEFTVLYLLSGPKTFDELAKIIPANVIPRTVKRLKHILTKINTKSIKLRENTSSHKMSNAEFQVYALIKEKKEVSIKELLEKVDVHPRTVYKCINKLENKGYIDKVREKFAYTLNENGVKSGEFLKKLIRYIWEHRGEEIRMKTVILSYLYNSNAPVSESELVDKILDPYFKNKYGKPVDVIEVQKIKAELRKEGLIVGNPYTGYALSRTAIEKLPPKLCTKNLLIEPFISV
ncbi:MAG: helix-turn-helix domain-containing protein [Candidatus Odinarchaeia archaeon]